MTRLEELKKRMEETRLSANNANNAANDALHYAAVTANYDAAEVFNFVANRATNNALDITSYANEAAKAYETELNKNND